MCLKFLWRMGLRCLTSALPKTCYSSRPDGRLMRLPATAKAWLLPRRAPLVTAPSTSAELVPQTSVTPSESLSFPLSWLLEHASAPIKYRAMTEVGTIAQPTSREVDWLPFSHRPAIRLEIGRAHV